MPLLHLLFLKSPPIAMSLIFCFAPCSSVPLPPSPDLPLFTFWLSALQTWSTDMCADWWAVLIRQSTQRATAQLAAASWIKKASFLRVFSSEKGIIQPFSLLYQCPIFIKLLGEEDFWDLCPEGIVRCGWNWLACSRSLGSGLTDRLVAWFHYSFS